MNFVTSGHKKAIELLIKKGANVNAVENRWKATPLHYIALVEAARYHQNYWTEDDYLRKFESYFLLKQRFMAQTKQVNRKKIISLTIEFAELLIDYGADVYAIARYGDEDVTALDLVASKKCNFYQQNFK